MIRVCMSGASGKLGRAIIDKILDSNNFELTAAIAKNNSGKKISDILQDNRSHLMIEKELNKDIISKTDVLIDYTKPVVVKNNVMRAIESGLNVVIGTSGLTDKDYIEIDNFAREKSIGVIAAGNFSITATLMQEFARTAAKYIPHWEILEYANDKKTDAPNGTSRELSYVLSNVQKAKWTVSPGDVEGIKESRGATLNGSQIHSIRVPGYYSSIETVFGLEGERLSIRHDSMAFSPYVQGTLLAAEKVITFKGLKRGLASILELR